MTESGSRIPVWRDARAVRFMLQAAFLVGAVLVLWYFVAGMLRELDALGLGIDFGFLKDQAGFEISEGVAYTSADSYARALWVGAVNTIRVVLVGIFFATLIGVSVGVARLSSNWLVRSIAVAYVETFRNTPLLLQLLFWYSGVILKLPPVRSSVEWFDAVFLNQRGLYLPRWVPSEGFSVWRHYLIAAVVVGLATYFIRRRRLIKEDRPGFPIVSALLAATATGVIGYAISPGPPLFLEPPRLERFNFAGGIHLSPEFAGLLMGLSIYTGAFIAEVVRGGIQSVDKGQRDAALAIGLRPFQVMYLVVLPQALRTIVPPVTSQYLNLAKNSSLAVAVGYPEIFNISSTMMNQSGQTIPVIVIIIAFYLGLSLLTSALMNWYNRAIRYRG